MVVGFELAVGAFVGVEGGARGVELADEGGEEEGVVVGWWGWSMFCFWAWRVGRGRECRVRSLVWSWGRRSRSVR